MDGRDGMGWDGMGQGEEHQMLMLAQGLAALVG